MPTFVEFFSNIFEPEMKKTRTLLEAIPDHDPAFTPHEKSMRLDKLTGHVAHLPGWIAMTINQDQFAMDRNTPPAPPLTKGGKAEMLANFDKNVADSRAALAATNDAHLAKNWKFIYEGHTVLDLPRTVVLTDVCLNHLIHHRGQLTVYIRLLGGKVPGLYGPSADEK
jgi:uncharacterized damage-inducible protein DinB